MRNSRTLRWALGLVLVLALVAAACGSGEDEEAADEEPDEEPTDEEATDDEADEPDGADDADEEEGDAAGDDSEEEASDDEEASEDEGGDGDLALDPAEEVTIAYVPIMKFATSYVAEGRGFFDDYGLDVTFEQVDSGTEAIAFLEEGTVDVGGIAIVASTWNAWGEGIEMPVIAPGGLEPEDESPTKFLVRSDLVDEGEVEEIADLEGRTIAAAGGPGSGGEYLLTRALEEGDLGLEDVEIQNIGNPEMPPAFESDAIDAGLLGSPYADQAESAGDATEMVNMAEVVPGAMTVAFVASGDLVNERPEVAERFALALTEAARAMQGDEYLSDENLDAYLEYVDTTEEDLREGDPVIYDPDQEIPVDGLADIERVHRENGRVDYEDELDINEVVDTSYVEWAREQLDE